MHGWGWYIIAQATNQGDHIHIGHTIYKGCTMCGWMKIGVLSSSALDGVWCTMSSNHTYRSWHPSQFINVFMGEVGLPLYRQLEQWGHIHTDHTILQGWTSMDERKLAYFLLLPWMVCDVPWAPTINADIVTPINSSVGTLMRLIHHCTYNQARGSHTYWSHNNPRMDQHGWNKTSILLALALVGVWCAMKSNHPYRF